MGRVFHHRKHCEKPSSEQHQQFIGRQNKHSNKKMKKNALLKKIQQAKKKEQPASISFDDSSSDESSSDDETKTTLPASNKRDASSISASTQAAPKKLKTGFAWGIQKEESVVPTMVEEEEESSDEEEEEDVETSTTSSTTRPHHHDVHHLTETEIAEIEESLPNKAPTSEADFERLVIGEPNNSFLWIQYMTFMLNTYGFEKAREIGDRAVSRIHFSKENERFNLWTAIISLYVSNNKPDIDKVIERALQGASHPQNIYLQYARLLNKLYEKKKQRLDAAEEDNESSDDEDEDAASIRQRREKELEELLNRIEQVYKKACKKYRNEKKVFEDYQQWCIVTLKDIKKAEGVLARSFTVFQKRDHIALKSKFAVQLYKYGDNVLDARNAMEDIIQNNPKRSDVWSIYLDCEQQHTNDKRYMREIFERVCNLTTLSTKKMKSFLQRYLKFETQHGDVEGVEHVKKIAKEYIQNKLEKSQNKPVENKE